MKHIFVESNWVFACYAPVHHRDPAAIMLLRQAAEGKIRLHLPAICLREAADAIRRKCQPREADALREFRRWARAQEKLTAEESDSAIRFLDKFTALVKTELSQMEERLDGLRTQVGVDVYPLNERMLERVITLRSRVLELRPFDEAILAAVLVRAEELRAAGESDLLFCNLDSDLRPTSDSKRRLGDLYREIGVAVQAGFVI